MTQKRQRNKRRGPVRDAAPSPAPAEPRYQKFLPEWMRGANGAPVRPPHPRRARRQRPVGGYTPGKFATDDRR